MSQKCPQCDEAKRVTQEWLDKQSHDRYWYYPDLFSNLVKILNVRATKTPSLPARAEFEEGCRKYQDEEYKGT